MTRDALSRPAVEARGLGASVRRVARWIRSWPAVEAGEGSGEAGLQPFLRSGAGTLSWSFHGGWISFFVNDIEVVEFGLKRSTSSGPFLLRLKLRPLGIFSPQMLIRSGPWVAATAAGALPLLVEGQP